MEFKSIPVLTHDVEDRTVTGFAAVTGNIDDGNDRIRSGAFAKTLQERKRAVPHLWQHEMENPPIATILDLQEVKRDQLPGELLAKYPDATGGLLVRRKYLPTPRAEEVYQGILADAIPGMSFGYEVPRNKSQFVKVGDVNVRDLIELKLIETSDTPFPMNTAARARKSMLLFNLLDMLNGIDDMATLLAAGQNLTPEQIATCQQCIALCMGLLEGAIQADQLDTIQQMSAGFTVLRKALRGATWFKGALAFHETPKAPESEAWDGSAEVAKASVDDLRAMCAWVDSENSQNKGAYKLPHHKADGDHTVVWNGVSAAMGALMGSRGGVDIPADDKEAVYRHLSRHYEQFDKTPPDYKALEIRWSVSDARALLASGVDFKQGRMISAANESQIRDVIDAIEKQLESLESLLGAAEPPADEASGKALTDQAALMALMDLTLAGNQYQ